MTAKIIDFDRDTFRDKMEKMFDGYLEDYTYEDLLEELQVNPFDTFMAAFDAGLIDEELFESFLTSE